MKGKTLRYFGSFAAAIPVAAVLSYGVATALAATPSRHNLPTFSPTPVVMPGFVVRYLTSDGFVRASHTDSNLVNAWGLAASPTGPWWVANNGTAVSTLYDANGLAQALVVSVPGAPTGTVYNAGSGFVVSDGQASGPARFLFASEDGTISGWSPSVPPPSPSTQAIVAVDNSASGAIYKGLAIASTASGDRLYAADFHNGKVDVFDGSFNPVNITGAFVDAGIPAGYAPFGIQNVGGRIVVTYAQQDANREDDVQGPGLGFVSIFDADGSFRARVATRGMLNAPWGIALTPPEYGQFGRYLLIGNFGDGRILAFRATDDMRQFTLVGALRDRDKTDIRIDGLWGLSFGNGGTAGGTDQLFFTAGPADETHGTFGRIDLVTTTEP